MGAGAGGQVWWTLDSFSATHRAGGLASCRVDAAGLQARSPLRRSGVRHRRVWGGDAGGLGRFRVSRPSANVPLDSRGPSPFCRQTRICGRRPTCLVPEHVAAFLQHSSLAPTTRPYAAATAAAAVGAAGVPDCGAHVETVDGRPSTGLSRGP